LFFERPESGEQAVLVHLNLTSESEREDPREFEELVLSAGGDPVAYVMGSRSTPHPRTFVGSGKLEEIQAELQLHGADLVMFNHALSPSQERNLEKELQCRVLDRTGLILDIFAQRARTHEGKLQVELAQLQHMSTRLVRGWTHLERQKGGIGVRGGPGEKQLETDRRLLRERRAMLLAKLALVQALAGGASGADVEGGDRTPGAERSAVAPDGPVETPDGPRATPDAPPATPDNSSDASPPLGGGGV